MKKLCILIVSLFVLQSEAFTQENPIRLGVKFGFPDFIGLHLEYLTPFLNERLAPSVSLSYLPVQMEGFTDTGNGDFNFAFTYLELGANYYFLPESRWLYANLSYGRVGLHYDFIDYYSDDTGMSGGVGKLDIGLNLVNMKLGAKLGKTFYFRPEIGVAIVNSNYENVNYTIRYPDGNTETIVEDVPSVFLGAIPVFNLGFGFAF